MKKLKIWLSILIIVLVGLYFSYPLILGKMADFLVVSDKLEKADLILVLAGDNNGERVSEAVKLFKQDYSNHLLMSGGPLAWKLIAAELMKKQAMAAGVPGNLILVEGKSLSTIGNANFSLPMVLKNNFKSVVLVTSPYHTYRAAKVFRKVFSPHDIKIIIWPVQKSDFNPVRWWTRHEDTQFVVWEYMALVLYFLEGF